MSQRNLGHALGSDAPHRLCPVFHAGNNAILSALQARLDWLLFRLFYRLINPLSDRWLNRGSLSKTLALSTMLPLVPRLRGLASSSAFRLRMLEDDLSAAQYITDAMNVRPENFNMSILDRTLSRPGSLVASVPVRPAATTRGAAPSRPTAPPSGPNQPSRRVIGRRAFTVSGSWMSRFVVGGSG